MRKAGCLRVIAAIAALTWCSVSFFDAHILGTPWAQIERVALRAPMGT